MKRILTIIFALSLAVVAFLPFNTVLQAEAQTTPTPIDVYIIAGQSNALGTSGNDGTATLDGRYDNIWYVSDGDRTLGSPMPVELTDIGYFKTYIAKGLGYENSYGSPYIGPEYGMAQIFNDRYANKRALFFKSAAGGTSIFKGDGSNTYGNWLPRSLWNAGYTPDGSAQKYDGALYYNMITGFKSVYDELVSENYAPVVKGMIWMHGCSNLGDPTNYETHLKALIADVRDDLITITGDKTLGAMPVIVGEISKTSQVPEHQGAITFSNMQRKVASEMTGVYTVSTHDLVITNPDGTFRNGRDGWHYCADDMIVLGRRFANALDDAYDDVIPSIVINDRNKGNATATVSGSTVTVEFQDLSTNTKRFYLKSVKVDGVDCTSLVSNNRLIINDATARPLVEVEFANAQSYTITYELDESKVGLMSAPKKIYSGSTVTIKPVPVDGYEIKEVLVDGVPVTANATGGYEIMATKNITVTINHQKEGASSSSAGAGGGCANAVTTVLSALGVLIALIFVVKK